jgi:hypothetical protein
MVAPLEVREGDRALAILLEGHIHGNYVRDGWILACFETFLDKLALYNNVQLHQL